MALTINWTYGSTSLDLPAPGFPERPGDGLVQRRTRTYGGNVVARTEAIGDIETPTLHFTPLTDAQYDALFDFLTVTVVGATYPFTFTDWDSVAHTVKYLGGLPGKGNAFDVWAVDITLAVLPT